MDPEKRKAKLEGQKTRRSKKEKKDRLQRQKEGICSRCGRSPSSGGRFCEGCLERGRRYNSKSKERKDYCE